MRPHALHPQGLFDVCRQQSAALSCCTSLDNGSQLAVGYSDGAVKLWALGLQARNLWTHTMHDGVPVQAIAASPNGAFLATGGRDGRVLVVQAATGYGCSVLAGHVGWPITSLHFSHENDVLLSTSRDGTVCVWGMGSFGPPIPSVTTAAASGLNSTGRRGSMLEGASSAVSSMVARTVMDAVPAQAHLPSPRAIHALRLPGVPGGREVTCCAVATVVGLGKVASIGTVDGRVYIISLTTGKVEKVLRACPVPVQSVAWSKDGGRLLGLGYADGSSWVIDAVGSSGSGAAAARDASANNGNGSSQWGVLTCLVGNAAGVNSMYFTGGWRTAGTA